MPAIMSSVRQTVSANLYLAADNCRNGCCVDFTAAAHCSADLIIKVGSSCRCEDLNKSGPAVVYLPQPKTIDFSALAAQIPSVIKQTEDDKSTTLIVFLDEAYHSSIDQVKLCFKENVPEKFRTRYLYVQLKENQEKRWNECRLFFNQ